MAGKREIKTRLKLEGEAQFKKGMNDAASAIKVLNSEQKLAEAQFAATGDAEEYAAEKVRILKEKIEQQERAVKNAKDAVEALKKDGVDENSKAMQTWKTRLNSARTSLITMKTKLNDTESALHDQGTALDNASGDAYDYSSAINEAARAVDFSATITAIDNVRDRLASIVKGAARAGKAIWTLEMGGASWADEIATAAQVAGMDVETYQGWLYASQLIDTSVDSIVGSYKRLNRNLDEPTDDILKSLNEIGVYNLDPVTGQARDTMDVFWDIVDALGTVENKSRRDQIAMELLGKSFDDLNPLIAAGSDAYKDYVEEGKLTAVSKENVEALTSLDDANVKLNATFEQTKNTLLAEMAPAFEKIADTMTTALNTFNEFMESDEGQEALANLRDAIGGIADKVGSFDFKAAMDNASGLITKLSDGLGWIADHSEIVVGGISAIAAAWAALTVSKDVLSVLQLINGINWGKVGAVAAGGGTPTVPASAAKNAVNTVNTGAANGAGAAAGAAKGGLLSGAAMSFKMAGGLSVAAPAAALVAAGVAGKKMIQANLEDEALNAIYGHDDSDDSLVDTMSKDSLKLAKDYWKVYSDAAKTGTEEAFEARDRLYDSLDKEGYEQTEQAVSLLENVFDNYMKQTDPDGLVEKLAQRDDTFFDVSSELAQAIRDGEADVGAASQEVAAATEAPLEEIDGDTMGYNVSAGLAQGISEGIPLAVGAAEALGAAVSGKIGRVLEIKSPSRVMRGLGEYVSEGFALGIEDNIDRVKQATGRMVDATTRPVDRSGIPGAARGAAGATGNGMTHITIQMDGRDVADVITPYVDSNIGATIARRR